jgi:polar amino acid transport system substrate-binding protein
MKYILTVFCLILSLPSYANKLHIGWEIWYPYLYRNSQQKLIGLDVEILNIILAKTGYSSEYTELPWNRHLHYLKTGEIDVAMGVSLNAERARYAVFTEPYRKEIIKLFVKTGSEKPIELATLSDLSKSNYMIGAESGYYYGEEYQELMTTVEFQKRIVKAADIEENVALLLKGDIDGFLVDTETAKAFSNKYQVKGEFEAHTLPIYQTDIHIMLSKKSVTPSVVKKINNAIGELKQSGELDKIIEKWNQLN